MPSTSMKGGEGRVSLNWYIIVVFGRCEGDGEVECF